MKTLVVFDETGEKGARLFYKDTLIGENILRIIKKPTIHGWLSRLKIRSLTKNCDILYETFRGDTVQLVLQSFDNVIEKIGADKIFFYPSGYHQFGYILPWIDKNKSIHVLTSHELLPYAESFFMDKTGAACVFPLNVAPDIKDALAVFFPGATPFDTERAFATLDLCGKCQGVNIIRPEDIHFRPPAVLAPFVLKDTLLLASLSQYFNIPCDNLYVFSAKIHK